MATLNNNWQMLAQSYLGSTGSLNVYIRIYARVISQNVASNSSVVGYESRLYVEGSGSYFYTGSTTTKTITGTWASGGTEDASGTYYKGETVLQTRQSTPIQHNPDGTQSISTSANFTSTPWGFNNTASANADLPKINRYAVTNSVTGSDIEQSFSVNYTKYINEYTYKLRISIPNVRGLERINYETSGQAFTLSQETIEDLYTTYTTTNTFNLGFSVETWNSAGTTKLSDGNEKVISCKITGATPIFNDFDYNDINPTTLALTGNSKYNINGYSTTRVSVSTINKAIAQKGASMVKYQLMIGTTSREVPYSDSEEVYINIQNSSVGEYKLYAIDSRGNSTLVTKLAQRNIEYTPLYIDYSNSSVERDDGGVGTSVTLTYRGNIWSESFGSVTNSITLAKYEFKKSNEDDTHYVTGSTNITPTISQGVLSFSGLVRSNNPDYSFDLQESYIFKITLEDELSSYTLILSPLPSGIPNISLNKNGVGIMCDYDEQLGGLFQVGGIVMKAYNLNYSTTETDTGLTWTDGKKIYSKVVTGTLPQMSPPSGGTAEANIAHNISNFNEVIGISGKLKYSGTWYMFPILSSGGKMTCIRTVSSTNIVLRSNDYWSAGPDLEFEVLYTKTTS